MEKYEILMESVKFNLWAKALKVSSQYDPTEFNGVRTTNTKIVRPKKSFLSKLKNFFR